MNDHPEPDGHADGDGSSRAALTARVRSLRLPQHTAAPPANRLRWLPWALCAVLGVSTAVLGGVALRGSPSTTPAPTPGAVNTGASSSAPVDSTLPAVPSGQVVLESKGYIVPVHQIQISPKVSGMVTKLNPESFPDGKGGIKEGMLVEKGAILAVLESVDYEADRNRAQAMFDSAYQRFLELYTGSRPEEIRQAKADLDEAEAVREQWYLEWKRNMQLNRQTLAPREYEQTFSSYKAAESRLEKTRQAYRLMLDGPRRERIQAAWADVEQAAADLTKAQWRLDNCIIRAPLTGTILSKKAEEGNIVNPVAFNVSASLCDMADLSDLEVDLNIQERDVANVFQGQRCRVRSEAFPKREYEGVVSRLMPIADRAKGAVPVRVQVKVPKEEAGKFLKPEMSVLVSFQAK